MRLPAGFQASADCAGIKESGALDLGLIYSPFPLYWAFVGTQNMVKAPCVFRNRARYRAGDPVNGIVINSGNANCATGEQGIWDNEDFAGIAAHGLALPRVQDILTASTGVIGEALPIDKIRETFPQLVQNLGGETDEIAQAILTTDTKVKQAAAALNAGARIVGIAKGSGMIHPNMATMLGFVMTDAAIPQKKLREVWPGIVTRSFNQVSVDGDTSTNDMAIVFSSRQVRADEDEFIEALEQVCQKLAKKIAQDGEGATKLLTVEVSGARSGEEARAAAKAIASSTLVKAAMFGNDPNWGRILAALGSAQVLSDTANVLINLQGTTVYHGTVQRFDPALVAKDLGQKEVLIEVNLAAGESSGTAWGCDLSPEYIRINADYRT